MLHTIKDDADAGKFIKAICKYMFEGKEPQELASPINNYFKLFRKSFDLSKHRSESGKKGGKAKKKPKKLILLKILCRIIRIFKTTYSVRN